MFGRIKIKQRRRRFFSRIYGYNDSEMIIGTPQAQKKTAPPAVFFRLFRGIMNHIWCLIISYWYTIKQRRRHFLYYLRVLLPKNDVRPDQNKTAPHAHFSLIFPDIGYWTFYFWKYWLLNIHTLLEILVTGPSIFGNIGYWTSIFI